MKRRTVLRPQAETEIAEAADWYEGQRRGLGGDFLQIVEQTIASIGDNPFLYRKVHQETRRAPLQRFPYGIFFRVRDEEIVIVACMHARRHERRWQGRQ